MKFEDILLKGVSFKDMSNILKIYNKRNEGTSRPIISLIDAACEYFNITYEECLILF